MTGADPADTLKQDSAKSGMKPWLACAALALACAAPAWAEVVINEVDTNPPGDDVRGASEWVELYNSGQSDAAVGGWQIVSSSDKALVLPEDAVVEAGKFATFSHGPAWFDNRGDSARLLDAAGNLLDATPTVVDVANDSKTWQRQTDGEDTDSDGDWKAGKPTWGASNALPAAVLPREPVTVSIQAGGPYETGQPVVITGSVSEVVYSGPRSPAQPVELEISGPSSSHTIRYPDADLEFSLRLPTGGALGFGPGQYLVTARYAEASASEQFSVADKPAPADAGAEQSLSVSTDRRSYAPGQDVSVSAAVSKTAPLAGLELTVRAPDGSSVLEGTLFPDRAGKFSTSYMVNPVSAQYGVYAVHASYDGAEAVALYEVSRDARGRGVSLDALSAAYEPGQTVTISGFSRTWTPALDISVEGLGEASGAGPLSVSDSVRLDGGGEFSFELPIPEWFDEFGTYRVVVSGGVGRASAEFGVAPNSGSYAPPSEDFFVSADSASYELGGSAEFSGNVGVLDNRDDADGMVSVEFFGESGPVSSRGETRLKGVAVDVPARLLLQPDSSGAFSGSSDLTALLFSAGQYTARAQYAGQTALAAFEIRAPEATAPLSAEVDKESYGLGETVRLSGASAGPDTAVVITLSKPDGGVEEHGALVDSGRFEWEWRAPLSEVVNKSARAGDTSNLGLHRLVVEAGGREARVQFVVSDGGGPAPGADLTVSAGSALHRAGDRLSVSGTAPVGGVSPVLVDVLPSGSSIPLLSARAYPGSDGEYSTSFLIPRILFPDGAYKVRALHGGERATDSFEVGEARFISLETARDRYAPGELAVLHASVPREERQYSVSVIRESSEEQACGVSVCGEYAGPSAALSESGPFAYAYRVPPGADGAHEVAVLSSPYEAHASFSVIQAERERDERSRIPDESASIEVREGALAISGSLLTRASDSGSVSLRLEAPGGACIVGQSPECEQSGPTGAGGSEARVFELRGTTYWLSYTGPDARAERFELGAFSDLPGGEYELSAVKDSEQSRLYYAVTYR